MFIDMHVHPTFYTPINQNKEKEDIRHEAIHIYKNGTASLEHIFNQMHCAKLDYLCLLPQDYRSEYGSPLVSNEEIKSLVDMAPDKFIGFASIDVKSENVETELERAFTDLSLKGLKLNLSRQRMYSYDDRLSKIYDICEKYRKPIIFHSGFSWEPNCPAKYSHPLEFEELAMKRPKLKVCLAHFGWPWVRETAMLLLKYPNIYADMAILYFDSAEEFYKQVFQKDIPTTWIDRSLRHQVMFGSNNPRFEQIRMANSLEKLGFRESTLKLIKGENAIEFLGGI